MRSRGGKGKGAWVALTLVAVLAASVPCRAEADRSVLESSRRATGFVLTEFKNVISMGTGFCIDTSGLFITNNHVISDNGAYGRISVVLAPGTPGARVLSATVVKADPNMDLALLRVDRATNLHTVDLAGTGRMGRLRETQEVMALGYPFGLKLAAGGAAPEVSVSTGKITALRHEGAQLAVIQFDGSINHGNSGGPLLDKYGNVIGVVTAIIPDKQINFAIPVSSVRALLAEAGIVIAPAALTEPEIGQQLVNSLIAPPKGRRAVPESSLQQSSLKLARDLFASAYANKTRTGQENLVYQLLDEAQTEKDDPTSRYVLLNEAKETAIRVGDFSAAILAAGELIDNYDLPPMEVMGELLKKIGPRLAGQDAADGATVSMLLVEAFAKQQAFAEARKWIPSTRAIAYASHNSKVIAGVAEGVARIEFDVAQSDEAQAAMAKLKTNPHDAAANLAVGQYQCFVCGDFAAGCAFLAKGNDPALKRPADAELTKPTTPEDQKACGDLWWDQSIVQSKVHAVAYGCKARAIYWYRKALPKLTGLVKREIELRVGESDSDPGPAVASLPGRGKLGLTNHTDASEAQTVIDAVTARYPQTIPDKASLELVKVHDAHEFRCNGGAGPHDVPDTYSGQAVGGKVGGQPMLWGIYEHWDAGHYLIVYRVQALSDIPEKDVCFLDVCTGGRTISGHHPAASEFTPGKWSCMPIQLNLDSAKELEFRLWPQNHSIVLDRVYVFRLH